jgi:NADH dehydrogenase FAD-containing subunit
MTNAPTGFGGLETVHRLAGAGVRIGKRLAVIDFGRIKLRGALAWWIWGLAQIHFLIGGAGQGPGGAKMIRWPHG